MKQCSKCKEVKTNVEFPMNKTRNGVAYLHATCRACRLEQCREWAKTPAARKIVRAGVLRRSYGLTVAEYEGMIAAQDGKCAICEQPETKVLRGVLMKLSVDHCHTTGAIRGLLCQACNVGLGSFGDDPFALRKAAAYIEARAEEEAA